MCYIVKYCNPLSCIFSPQELYINPVKNVVEYVKGGERVQEMQEKYIEIFNKVTSSLIREYSQFNNIEDEELKKEVIKLQPQIEAIISISTRVTLEVLAELELLGSRNNKS
jgi:hypothetical protein